MHLPSSLPPHPPPPNPSARSSPPPEPIPPVDPQTKNKGTSPPPPPTHPSLIPPSFALVHPSIASVLCLEDYDVDGEGDHDDYDDDEIDSRRSGAHVRPHERAGDGDSMKGKGVEEEEEEVARQDLRERRRRRCHLVDAARRCDDAELEPGTGVGTFAVHQSGGTSDEDGDDMALWLLRALGQRMSTRGHKRRGGGGGAGSSPDAVAGLLLATLWLEESIGRAIQNHQQQPPQRLPSQVERLLSPTTISRRPPQAPLLSRMLIMYRRLEDEGGTEAGKRTSPSSRMLAGSNDVETNDNDDDEELKPLSSLLSILLLPNDGGLNLRNLVWHGFLGKVDRAWLALVVHLTRRVRAGGGGAAAGPAASVPATSAATAAARSTIPSISSSDDDDSRIPVARILAQLPASWSIIRADRETVAHELCRPGDMACDSCLDDNGRPPWGVACRSIENWMPTPDHVELWRLARAWIESTSPDGHNNRGAVPDSAPCGGALLRGEDPDPRPIGIICAVLVVLLEAGLRRMFCIANLQRRGRDDIARPGAYYVTLDGHGQRDRHELLLQPYLFEADVALVNEPINSGTNRSTAPESAVKVVTNRLLERLGASRTSFLSDLFVSPHGPNLRAALSHGAWSARMKDDVRRWAVLEGLSSHESSEGGRPTGSTDTPSPTILPAASGPSDEEALDSMEALLSALYCCAITDEIASDDFEKKVEDDHEAYHPQCSFTAVVLATLRGIRRQLDRIAAIFRSPEWSTYSDDPELAVVRQRWQAGVSYLNAGDAAATGSVVLRERLDEAIERFREAEEWTLPRLYREHETNRFLGPLVAQRALLKDVLGFLTHLTALLTSSLHDLAGADPTATPAPVLSSRQRRSKLRLLGCAEPVYQFASFACHVALASLEEEVEGGGNNKESLKLVERTRNVLSTVHTFLAVNSDLALKAVQDYSRSKLVKERIRRDGRG